MGTLLESIVASTEQFFADTQSGTAPPALDVARRWTDAVKRGCIFFYETTEVEIGLKDIDWSGAHVAHQEWPAQLNRFYCLPHLCACYAESGDPELPALARQLIEDWIAQHDYQKDGALAPRDNTLNLSIRLGQSTGRGWWPAIARFNCPTVFDDAFLQAVIESTRGQLALLRTKMSAVGNWRISQLDTMLTTALILPEFETHLDFAVRNLNEAFHRQIHADGSHEEHNPSYHAWMRNVFTSLWSLADARPELGLIIDGERVARMWDYSLFSSAPDGGSLGMHDGRRWTPPSGSRTDLAGHRKARRKVLDRAGLTGEAWDEAKHPSRAFASAGQVFLRSSMGPEAELVSFDATNWGGGHCHLSRNAINLYSGGRMLLCDPGIFSYEDSDTFMAYGKSTPAHNTLNIDYMSQSQANPHLHEAAILDGGAIVSATYDGGYYPGTYTWGWWTGKHAGTSAAHTRTLLWLPNRFCVIWDHLHVADAVRYGIHWQFPPGPSACAPERRQAWTAAPGERNILVRQLFSSDDPELHLVEGRHSPATGWLPVDTQGRHEPAPMVQFMGHTRGNASNNVFLLAPFDDDTPPEPEIDVMCDAGGVCQAFTLRWPDGSIDHIAASSALRVQIDELGPFTTDMDLVHVREKDDRIVSALGHGGLYLKFRDALIEDRRDTRAWSRSYR